MARRLTTLVLFFVSHTTKHAEESQAAKQSDGEKNTNEIGQTKAAFAKLRDSLAGRRLSAWRLPALGFWPGLRSAQQLRDLSSEAGLPSS